MSQCCLRVSTLGYGSLTTTKTLVGTPTQSTSARTDGSVLLVKLGLNRPQQKYEVSLLS